MITSDQLMQLAKLENTILDYIHTTKHEGREKVSRINDFVKANCPKIDMQGKSKLLDIILEYTKGDEECYRGEYLQEEVQARVMINCN